VALSEEHPDPCDHNTTPMNSVRTKSRPCGGAVAEGTGIIARLEPVECAIIAHTRPRR